MAATARATANIRESSTPMPVRKMESRNTAAQMIMMTVASLALNLSRLSWSGVLRCWVWFMSAAILPSSVSMPVAVTSTVARP